MMTSFNDILSEIRRSFPVNKTSISLLVLLLCLIIWGGFRACSRNDGVDRQHLFKIARDPTWYPLNVMGKEKNLLAFTNDLLLAIAQNEGVRVALVNGTADTLFEDLEDGDYDAILSSMMPTSFHRQQFEFSDPLYLIGPVLIVSTDSKATSLADLNNKSVAVRRGANVLFDISEYKVNYVPYDTMSTAFEDLTADYVDGIILPVLQAHFYTQTLYAGKLKIISSSLTKEGIRLIAMNSPSSKFFLEHFNKGLKVLKSDGTYDKLLTKWGLINSDANNVIIPQAVNPTIELEAPHE